MPLSLSLLLLATTVGDGFFEQEGACVRLSVSVCLCSSRARRGGVLSFFAAGACACAGAVLFFFFLLICLNSDPTWDEERGGSSVCLSVCLSVGDK